MAIKTNDKITYQDLIDYTLKYIKDKCVNIDTLDSNISSQLKNGATFTLTSANLTKKSGTNTTKTVSLKSTATVNDSLLVTVTSLKVETELKEFLTSRGILSKVDELVTFKGIINYYSNVSSFISTKLLSVTNSFDGGVSIFYNKNNTSYPIIS